MNVRLEAAVSACALVAALLTYPSTAQAQLQVGSVSGTVVIAPQRPLAGGVVALQDPQGAVIVETVTDAAGRFAFPDVAPGSYLIEVREGDARLLALPVVVRGSLAVELVLDASPSVRESVVVQGDATAVAPARLWSVAGDTVRGAFSALPSQRVQGALSALPGWTAEDNGLVHVRGVDDGLLYVIDGVPVYERMDRLFGLAPAPASIVSLNVFNGYVPPEFGFKSGGVVQLRSASGLGRSWSGTVDMGVADFSTRSLEGAVSGPFGESAGLMVHVADERSDRFLDPVHPENFHNSGRSTSGGGQLTARRGSHLFTGNLQVGRSRFEVPNDEEQADFGQDQHQRIRQVLGSGSWQRSVGTRTVCQLSVYRRDAEATLAPSLFDLPVTTSAERLSTRTGAAWSLTHERGQHLFKVGAEASRLELDETFRLSVTDEEEAEEAGLSEEALEHGPDDPFAVVASAAPSLLSFFIQDTFRASDRLTVDYGVRLDRSQMLLTRSQLSPRVGIAYRAGARTTLRASVLRLFQPPQAEYLVLASSPEARELSPFVTDEVEGGADIEPERQTAFEGSVTHELSSRLRLDAASWYRRGSNVDDPNVFMGTTITFPNSVARQRAYGMDVRLDLLPASGLSAAATYSYTRVTQFGPINGGLFFEDDFIEIGEGTEFTPDHDLRHALTVEAGYGRAGAPWRVSGVARYRTGTPIEIDDDGPDELLERAGAETVDVEAGRVRPRLTIDLQAQWTVARTSRTAATVSAWVENITDKLYAYNFGNPFSGTHFGAPRRAGLALKLTY